MKQHSNFRKLAAIDIVFLGYKLILSEYSFGVLFSRWKLGDFEHARRSKNTWEIGADTLFFV